MAEADYVGTPPPTASSYPAEFSHELYFGGIHGDPALKVPLSIASNSQLYAQGLALLLKSYIEFQLIGTFTGETCLMGQLPSPDRHTVMIDGHLGAETVVACIQRWRSCSPPAYVIVLESENDTETILSYIEAGASGYSLQGASAAEVAAIIREVHHGMARCSPTVTAELFSRVANLRKTSVVAMAPTSIGLTVRELEVVRCLAMGYSNKEIAAALVITIHTVKHHVHNILEKLELSHRREAVAFALTRGWIRNE